MKRRKRLTFWGANEDDDSLPVSVIEGRKTVTSEVLEDYHKSYGDFGDGGYEVGDIVEVYDLRKNLRCLIEVTKVYPIKFGNIPEEVWRGETFKSAKEYQDCHIRCMPDRKLHDEFEFMTLHFKLIEEDQTANKAVERNSESLRSQNPSC